MRILHVSSLYYPSLGGNQTLCQWISEKMAELGENVTVFTARAFSEKQFEIFESQVRSLPREETINGVVVRRFQVNYRLRELLLKKLKKMRGGWWLLTVVFGDALNFWEHGPVVLDLFLSIVAHRPDVILATNNSPFTTYLCYLVRKIFKFPLVIMPLTHASVAWSSHPFLTKIYNTADLVLASTDFEQKHLLNMGVRPEKVKVMGHGIEADIFAGAKGERFKAKYHLSDGPVVGYVGRKVAGKGIDTLIDAMALVWKQRSDVQLVLAGSAEEKTGQDIENRLARLSPEEKARVRNTYDFSNTEKGDIYAALDVFAMASNVDSFGMANLEAWISGVPIIACRNTPQETMFEDGKDGLLVEYNNKEELAEAILKMVRDKDLSAAMGRQGREKVLQRYTLDVYARALRDEYRRLTEKNQNMIDIDSKS